MWTMTQTSSKDLQVDNWTCEGRHRSVLASFFIESYGTNQILSSVEFVLELSYFIWYLYSSHQLINSTMMPKMYTIWHEM